MTVEELRQRRRDLLARKKYELDLQEQGQGDNLALFMVQEELLDVNAQLRSLLPGHRIGGRRTTNQAAMDRQQYINWTQANGAPASDGVREAQRRALRETVLTQRQRQAWDLFRSGMDRQGIARRLGVSPSCASRLLKAAKGAMREEAERSAASRRLDGPRLDMKDPEAVKLLLSAVTAKQAAYLYLYYSEWLSLREISALVNTDFTAIHRTIRRGLRNICGALGCREAEIVNMEALDDAAYALYSQLQDLDDIVPQERRPVRHTGGNPARRVSGPASGDALSPEVTVCVSGGRWDPLHGRTGPGPGRRGKLLAALLERAKGGTLLRWLQAVFLRAAHRLGRAAARKWKRIQTEEEGGRYEKRNAYNH